jgi:hypothetical protein
VNGKQSKRLRKIARTLGLNPANSYAPMGVLRRLPERTYVDRRSGETKVLPGGVLRRPFALKACERKAYQEAKALYKGADPGDAPLAGPVILHPTEESRSFADRAVDSMKQQPEGPVDGK